MTDFMRIEFGLENEVDFAVTRRKAHLIRLFNCGVRKSTGEIVALIRPGIELDESWDEPVWRSMADPEVRTISPIVVSPLKPSKIVAAGVTKEFGFCRQLVGHNSYMSQRKLRNISPLGPTSWMALYRKSVLDQIGTCDEMLDPVYLDLDLALAISALGYRCSFEPECVVSINRSTPLIRESSLAHGRSAKRAMRRHAADVSFGTTLLTITAELIKSPMRPWLLQHTMQRIRAGAAGRHRSPFCGKDFPNVTPEPLG